MPPLTSCADSPVSTRLALAFLALAAAACGGGEGGGGTPPPPPPAVVAAVEVSPASVSLAIGGTTQLGVTARDASGNVLSGRSTTWASSAVSIASVSTAGLVTGVAAGTATITATVESRTGSATVTVTPPPVATVTVTPAAPSVLAGTNVQLTVALKDAAGADLTGRTVTWTSSAPAVATVSATGLVTTLTPGSATITATSEGKSAGATLEVVDPLRIPAFHRPFPDTTQYTTTNYHDHDIPRSFFDNGRRISYWGESFKFVGYEGHEGYDWRMAEGNPILAAADGTVLTTTHDAFFCPLLNATIPAGGNGTVVIDHQLPGGVRVRTLYAHMSRRDVQAGDRVTAGQQIGLSGGVGCSLNPHLHFGTFRVTQTKNGLPSIIDPYGWEGSGADPWLAEPEGAASMYLWKQGQAPALFSRATVDFNANGGTTFFGLSAIQAMGVRDAANPNNEYLEVSRDARFAPATLSIAGAQVRTKAGVIYTFPAGATLSAGTPTIRVYTGAGANTATTLYMGLAAGAYDNLSECVEVLNAAAQVRGRIGWGAGCS